MSNLKWADVAHYYLASKITMQNVGKPSEYHKSFVAKDIMDLILLDRGDIQLMPVLRHLEDMTEGEIIEWLEKWPIQAIGSDCDAHTMHFDPKWIESDNAKIERTAGNIRVSRPWFEHFRDDYFVYCQLFGGFYTPKQVYWLISKGFDVFGLIESGQAIRKGVES